jgi:hypothetical protein
VLDSSGSIEDPVFDVPLLIRGARADDAVARALVAKRNPVLEETFAQRDLQQLRRWIARAAQCATVDDLL